MISFLTDFSILSLTVHLEIGLLSGSDGEMLEVSPAQARVGLNMHPHMNMIGGARFFYPPPLPKKTT